MFILKKVGCRAVQLIFLCSMPIQPYKEPEVLSSCSQLGDVFAKEKTDSVLIITDAGIVKNGLIASLEAVLKQNKIKYTVYDQTQPNPSVKNVEDALVLYRQNNCNTLIAIGGGSAIDCAKAVGARAVYPKTPLNKMAGLNRVLRKLPPLIAIPTTAGTGSEAALAAVITDGDTHHKYLMMSYPLIPSYAVLDVSLTYTLPAHLTAITGMDALTHAVEAYIGRSTTRETRELALEATKLIFENLEKAYADGRDHTARENMLRAAHMAGIAFSKSYVGYIHAIAHSLGGRYDTPHGLANAVVMPYVLEEYGSCVYDKLHRLGIAAGVCSEQDSPESGAKVFIEAIRSLNAKMNIPEKMEGIQIEDIPEMAKYAEKEANPFYPVPKLMTKKELERFYYRIADWSEA